MRKLFFITSILFWHTSFCQIDSIYARIEIKSISLQEHRTWIDTSIVITREKKIVSAKPLTIHNDYGMGTTTIQGLQVDYKEHYFIIR